MILTKMGYHDFTNCKIALIVSFAITFNCEEGRRLFLEQFEKEPPPVRTLRDWKARFLEILTVMPLNQLGATETKDYPQRRKKFSLNGGHFEQNL